MTQHDAKTAVRHLRRNYCELQEIAAKLDGLPEDFLCLMETIAGDLSSFEQTLHAPKPAMPNCRHATREELETLCHASNVVMFPAVA